MELVALLSKGEGSWGQVSGLIKKGEWSKIILLGPAFASEFRIEGFAFDFIQYNDDLPLAELKDFLLSKLKDKLGEDFSDVALSIASGGGKEHMAVISAIQSVPRGIRFTALTKDGIIYI